MKKIILLFLFIVSNVLFSQTYLLYGGKDQKTFLGCLNCASYDTKSIWCSYGEYGSTYSPKSIWTTYGEYGSTYSPYSPWTTYADKPPAIVDKDGNFYGYFTLNRAIGQRANFKLVNVMYEYHDLIQKDVTAWHKKLFR